MPKYVAQKWISPQPDSEVNGQLMLMLTENIHAENVQPLLERHGLPSVINPTDWYPYQKLLDLYKDLADTGIEEMVAIGMKALDTTTLPPGLDTLPKFFFASAQGVVLNGRNLPEGYGFFPKQLGEKHFQMIVNLPDPMEVVYGYYWAACARLKPRFDVFIVRMIDNPNPEEQPGVCFDIRWGAHPGDLG